MLTRSWRRFRSPAAWTLVLVLGAPMLAEAQQSGLFPLAPIRRQRVPCPMEDPVYGLYRQEYFGYHPTCWRRFPAGWGCPSPEAPNVVAAFDPKQGGRKRDEPPPVNREEPGALDEPGMEAPPLPGGPGGNALPPVPPGDRSPFDLDTRPDNAAPPLRPGGARPGGERPGGERPAPPPANSPLELPPPAGAEKAEDAPPPAGPAPTGRIDSPAPAGPENAPLLALPDPVPAPAPAAPPTLTAPSAPAQPGPAVYMPQAPVQAPRRTSMLGGLFNGLRRR